MELNDPSGLVLLGELQFEAGDLDAAKLNWTKAAQLKPTGPTGHPAQPSANASAQQGADLLKLIDYRQGKGQPGKFAFVQMPHVHQGYNNCGSTACRDLCSISRQHNWWLGFQKALPVAARYRNGLGRSAEDIGEDQPEVETGHLHPR